MAAGVLTDTGHSMTLTSWQRSLGKHRGRHCMWGSDTTALGLLGSRWHTWKATFQLKMKAETDSGDVRLTLMLHMRDLFAMWEWQRHKYLSHYLLPSRMWNTKVPRLQPDTTVWDTGMTTFHGTTKVNTHPIHMCMCGDWILAALPIWTKSSLHFFQIL